MASTYMTTKIVFALSFKITVIAYKFRLDTTFKSCMGIQTSFMNITSSTSVTFMLPFYFNSITLWPNATFETFMAFQATFSKIISSTSLASVIHLYFFLCFFIFRLLFMLRNLCDGYGLTHFDNIMEEIAFMTQNKFLFFKYFEVILYV